MIKKIISSSIITVLIFFSCAFDFLLIPQFALADSDLSASVGSITTSSAKILVTMSRSDLPVDFSLCKPIPGAGPMTINTNCSFAYTLNKVNVTTTKISYNLSGLDPNIEYSYLFEDPTRGNGFTNYQYISGTFTTLGSSAGVTVTNITPSSSNSLMGVPGERFTIILSDPTINQIGFIYGTDPSLDPTKGTVFRDMGATFDPSTKKFDEIIGNLATSTTYYYAVTDSVTGAIYSGSKGSFKTYAGLTSSSTTTSTSSNTQIPTVSNITATSSLITLKFTSSTMPAADPVVYYSTVSNDLGIYSDNIRLSNTSGNDYTGTIPGLLENTKYYFSVFDGNSNPYGTINQTFTTTGPGGGGTGSGTVTISNFSANTNTNGSTITFLATATGVATNADFDYSFACGVSSTSIGDPVSSYTIPIASIKNPLSLSDSLSILPPHAFVSQSVPYYCQILDSTGHALSSVVTVTIASGQPDVPYISSVTDTQATIKVNLSNTTMTPPYIMYGDSPTNLTSAQIPMSALDGRSYSGDITGLNASTTYYYQVFNNSSFTPQPYGDAVSFKTTEPGAPTIGVIHGTIKPIDTTKYSGGLVTCGKGAVVADPNNSRGRIVSDYCNFQSLMAMINKFIGIMVFVIAPAIAAICMAWGGFLYMTSAGGEGKGKAKSLLIDAFVGWLLAFASWIIIKFILVQLGYADGWMKFW